MIDKTMPVCPQCGENDRVEKVSTLYLEGLRVGNKANDPLGQKSLTGLSKAEISELRHLLAPPSSGKSQVTRPIHPDLILLVFTGVLPVFLVGIMNNQRVLLIPV